MDDPLYLPCCLTIDGEEIASDHAVADVGPYGISITSASARADVELQSIYLAARGCPQVLVSEYAQVAAEPIVLSSRWMNAAEGVLPYAPARCLYDHLQRLQDLAEAHLGRAVGVAGLAEAEGELRVSRSVG